MMMFSRRVLQNNLKKLSQPSLAASNSFNMQHMVS
jgi:hypothetical protein